MGAVKAGEKAYYDYISDNGSDGAFFPVFIRGIIVGDDLCTPMGEEAIVNRIPSEADANAAAKCKKKQDYTKEESE
jgi:hypothetical protein